MPDPSPNEPYAVQYSNDGRESRKKLPPEVAAVLFDVLDALAADPNAFPDRVRPISRDGNTKIYSHPFPPLQVVYEIDAARRVLYLQYFVSPVVVQVPKPVFISYSHKDSAWLEKVQTYLQPLMDKKLIRVWADSEIRPGADWLAEIRRELGSAQVAVFLVTQNFLNSPFIREQELPALIDAAKGRGCLIFWIAVSSTTPIADTPLAPFQAAIAPNAPLDLMSEPEQNKVLADIYAKLKQAVVVV